MHPSIDLLFWLYCRPCSWSYRDRWIGFVTSQGCTCSSSFSSDVCDACRATWTWLDGSPVNIERFKDNEPSGYNEICALFRYKGDWSGYPCSKQLKSVCKKGNWRQWLQVHYYQDVWLAFIATDLIFSPQPSISNGLGTIVFGRVRPSVRPSVCPCVRVSVDKHCTHISS